MGYVSLFNNDVFISYSHNDNQSPLPDADADTHGWVSQFQRYLRIRLSESLGTEAAVWRDVRLRPANVLTDTLSQEIARAAVFIAIVSPSYQRSNWCRREHEAFRTGAAGGVRVGDRTRVVKVVKAPLDDDEHNRTLDDALASHFFEEDKDSGRRVRFEPGTPKFNQAIDDLAEAIGALLKEMRKRATVYVGAAGARQQEHRTKIVDELQAKRIAVVSAPAIGDVADADAFGRLMQGVGLSVHFLENDAEAEGDRAAALELGAASDHGVDRVVAIAQSNLQVDGKAIVPKGLEGANVVLEKGEESLKDAVLERVKMAQSAAPRGSTLTRIYLVCDAVDHPVHRSNAALAIRDYLVGLGYEVKTPPSDPGPAAALRRDNKDKLTRCDGVLVYWDQAADHWVDARFGEIEKALGWRRARSFRSKALYITAPMQGSKAFYKSLEPDVIIREWEKTLFANLEPFLARLRAEADGDSAADE